MNLSVPWVWRIARHITVGRKVEFVPMWEIAVFFAYAMRRVNCPRCSVKAEEVPWAEGKHRLTRSYQWSAIPAECGKVAKKPPSW